MSHLHRLVSLLVCVVLLVGVVWVSVGAAGEMDTCINIETVTDCEL